MPYTLPCIGPYCRLDGLQFCIVVATMQGCMFHSCDSCEMCCRWGSHMYLRVLDLGKVFGRHTIQIGRLLIRPAAFGGLHLLNLLTAEVLPDQLKRPRPFCSDDKWGSMTGHFFYPESHNLFLPRGRRLISQGDRFIGVCMSKKKKKLKLQ